MRGFFNKVWLGKLILVLWLRGHSWEAVADGGLTIIVTNLIQWFIFLTVKLCLIVIVKTDVIKC